MESVIPGSEKNDVKPLTIRNGTRQGWLLALRMDMMRRQSSRTRGPAATSRHRWLGQTPVQGDRSCNGGCLPSTRCRDRGWTGDCRLCKDVLYS